MHLYFDVHYRKDIAKSVAAEFNNWQDPTAIQHHIQYIDEVAEYIPGQFYKRELPCILAVLKHLDLMQVETIVVDGFVVLDNDGKLGMGGYLYEELGQQIPIIGVAKTGFHKNTVLVEEVLRGASKKPLFVTALGIDKTVAAGYIRTMYGDFRMPDILAVVDRITKEE